MAERPLVVGYEQFGVFEHKITVAYEGRRETRTARSGAEARVACEVALGVPQPEPEPARLVPASEPSRARPRRYRAKPHPHGERLVA